MTSYPGPGPEECKLRNRLCFKLFGHWPASVVHERLSTEAHQRRRGQKEPLTVETKGWRALALWETGQVTDDAFAAYLDECVKRDGSDPATEIIIARLKAEREQEE